MSRRTIIALAIAATPVAAAEPAACESYAKVLDMLSNQYSMTKVGTGNAGPDDKAIVEVYASRKTGTWAVIGTNDTGVTCIIVAGTAWDAEFEEIAK